VSSVKKLGGEHRIGQFENDKHGLNEKCWNNSVEQHDKTGISLDYSSQDENDGTFGHFAGKRDYI
jgi:hypothetical protein